MCGQDPSVAELLLPAQGQIHASPSCWVWQHLAVGDAGSSASAASPGISLLQPWARRKASVQVLTTWLTLTV